LIRTIVIVALGVLGALPGCSGGEESDTTGTGSSPTLRLYSCYVPDDFLCQEQSGSPFGDCEAGGGIAGDECPTDKLYGICRIARSDATLELNVYVYDGWETAGTDAPEEQCALLEGTWEPG
jgi:hypothetical protein